VLEASLCHSNIAGPPQTERPHTLGNGAFYAGPIAVFIFELFRLLSEPGILEGFVLLLRPNVDCSPLGFRFRAERERGTLATIRLGEHNVDRIVPTPIFHRHPTGTDLSCWAGRFLLLPVDFEMGDVKSLALSMLPSTIVLRQPNEINLTLLKRAAIKVRT
jgi:hypothetical protein